MKLTKRPMLLMPSSVLKYHSVYSISSSLAKLFQNLHSLCIDSIRAMCVYSQCVADTQECGVVVLWKFPNTQQQFLLSVGGVFVRNIERLGLE